MIDYFALALTHALLVLACWRLLQRTDLDRETPAEPDSAPQEPTAPARPRLKVRPRA